MTVGVGFGSTMAHEDVRPDRYPPRSSSPAHYSPAAGGILWLSRIPVDGSYLSNLLAPLSGDHGGAGLGLCCTPACKRPRTRACRRITEGRIGRKALITASFQLGSSPRPGDLQRGLATQPHQPPALAAHTPPPEALTAGFPAGPARQRASLPPLAAGEPSRKATRPPTPRGEPAEAHTRNPTRPGTLLPEPPRITQHNEIPGWRSTPSGNICHARAPTLASARTDAPVPTATTPAGRWQRDRAAQVADSGRPWSDCGRRDSDVRSLAGVRCSGTVWPRRTHIGRP